MPPRTVFLSRLIGLYCLLASLAMAAHREATVGAVTAITHSPGMLFLAGIFTLLVGLAMVLGHNVWSGGVLPVVVTLTGWAALLKGTLALVLLPVSEAQVFGGLDYGHLFYVYCGIGLVLGIYLTYAGFTAEPR
jgi:hypothetical protein